MTILTLILARAGSKGVPGKNRALIAGRPCVSWTLDAALASRRTTHIAVSTDDPEIATIARDAGAVALSRPPHLASDTARVDDAARDAMLAFECATTVGALADSRAMVQAADPNARSSAIVILYANVPIRPPGLIDRAIDLLLETGADSVQSYQPVGKHHPWWTARVDPASGDVRPWEGDTLNHGVYRRQDLPPAHIPDGGVLAVTRRALMLEVPGVAPGPHAFFGADRRGLINPEGSVVDIDSPADLLVAEAMLRSA
jgi:N-acylneuraminate cytidylyltransferase